VLHILSFNNIFFRTNDTKSTVICSRNKENKKIDKVTEKSYTDRIKIN